MIEQEVVFTDKEINEIWVDLNSAKQELEHFESKDAEKKKAIIIRIRDDVRILVKAKKIPIKENLIKNYVLNILEERGISYSRGHFTDLFEDTEKRNYLIDPKGSIHQHDFKIISENKNGKWEQCQCGTNKINDIEQIDLSTETDENKKISIRETIEPQGISFEYLKLVRELFAQNIHAIDMIFQKCTLDITSIKKQTTENKKRRAPQVEYDKLYNATKLLVDKRVFIVQKELSDIDESKLSEKKKSIADILNSTKKLNDRTKITNYEKAVAKILLQKFDFFIGDIANILNITTKHVKNNILKQNSTSPHDQDSILEQLDFLARCPGCGLGIADSIDKLHERFKQGHSIEEGFELDSFPLPKYADQVIQLKHEIRRKDILIHQLQK
jgi:hypothetical protein